MYSEYAIITSRLGFKSVAVGSGPTSAADFESDLPIGKLSSSVTSENVSDVSLRGIFAASLTPVAL